MSGSRRQWGPADQSLRVYRDYWADLYLVMVAVITAMPRVTVSFDASKPEPFKCQHCGKEFEILEAKCPRCYAKLQARVQDLENQVRNWESKLKYIRSNGGEDGLEIVKEMLKMPCNRLSFKTKNRITS